MEIHSPAHRFALHLFGHMHESKFRSYAEGGADARRRLQGCSLFSKEPWGRKKERRLQGYSLCKLTIRGDTAKLRIWPRAADKKEGGGWEIDKDQTWPGLDRDDGGTQPMPVRLLRTGRASAHGPSAGYHRQGHQPKEFESLERVNKLVGEKYKDKAFKARLVERTLMVDRPNAELEVREDLVSVSRQPQADVMRYFATDTPTEESDLEFKAWVKLNGKWVRAHESLERVLGNHRVFVYRISFGGQVINPGKSVQIRMEWKEPNSVPLDHDYWAFSTDYFEKLPETLTMKVAFAKNPADRSLVARAKDRSEPPMNIPAAVKRTINGRTWYVNTITIKSPKDSYVFEWTYPRSHSRE